jgi:hypothetical protein
MNFKQLKQITSSIWVKEQPLKYLGLEVGTRMTIVRLANEELALISPIKLNEQIITEINSLGTVKYIIAPNLFHYLYAQSCKNTYPSANLITPPGLEAKQPNIKSDLIFTQDVIDFNGKLEYFLFAGYQIPSPSGVTVANEIVFYHPESKTLILTDAAFNLDNSFPFITQLASRIIGCYQQLRPSILEKIVTKDKKQITRSIEKLLQWDFQKVIMAHGTIVENNAKQQLKEGYEWFLNTGLDI